MLLFKREDIAGVETGAITVSFRRWQRARVKAGREYALMGGGHIAVERVEPVPFSTATEADARRSGFPDRDSLRVYLERERALPDGDATDLYRVEFRYLGPDLREPIGQDDELSPEDITALAARLAKMDRLSRHGPWTRRAIALIAANPHTAASKLSPQLNRETPAFKADVRKLKALGLTISHETGYEISPRGHAFLEASGWLRDDEERKLWDGIL
jgi:hypothetical protein